MPNGDRSHHCSRAEDQASFVGWRLAKWVSYPKAALSEWHPNLATTCWHQTDLSKTTEHYRTVAALLSSFIHFAAFLGFGAINERFAPVCAACDLPTILKLPLSVLALAEMKVSYLNFACLEHHHCLERLFEARCFLKHHLWKSLLCCRCRKIAFSVSIFSWWLDLNMVVVELQMICSILLSLTRKPIETFLKKSAAVEKVVFCQMLVIAWRKVGVAARVFVCFSALPQTFIYFTTFNPTVRICSRRDA